MTKRNKLSATAFHEAGHAVASLVLKLPFKYVTIETEITPEIVSAGHIQHWPGLMSRPNIKVTPRVQVRTDALVSALVAGPIAERRHTGRINNIGAKYDIETSVRLAIRLRRADRTTTPYLNWRKAVAEVLIDSHWKEVKVLARALLKEKRLTAKQVRTLLGC